MAKTVVDIDRKTYYNTNIKTNIYTKFILALGYLVVSAERGRDLWLTYCQRMAARQAGALTPAQVTALTDLQPLEVGQPEARLAPIKMTEAVLSAPDRAPLHPHQRGTKLLLKLLTERSGEIRSVSNVGARIDIASSLCAERFPDIQFCSVDFQPHLEKDNEVLGHKPNWHFRPGYALEMWQRGEITSDVVFFTSTACLFNNAELNAYMEAMAPTTKFIVLAEQWFPEAKALWPFGIIKPEDIKVEHPILAGWEGIYLHNYIGKLEKYGYKIAHAKIMPTVPGRYCMEVVAEKV